MRQTILGVATTLLVLATSGDGVGQPVPSPGGAARPGWSTHSTPAQLEQLAAPVALYPVALAHGINEYVPGAASAQI